MLLVLGKSLASPQNVVLPMAEAKKHSVWNLKNMCRTADFWLITIPQGILLLGAVGGTKWDNVDPEIRPEKALLGLRFGLGLYANIRPVTIYDELKDASPLKNTGNIDFVIVRELTGGIYFGKTGSYQSGDRLPDGTVKGKIAYAKLYSWALTPEQIANLSKK